MKCMNGMMMINDDGRASFHGRIMSAEFGMISCQSCLSHLILLISLPVGVGKHADIQVGLPRP